MFVRFLPVLHKSVFVLERRRMHTCLMCDTWVDLSKVVQGQSHNLKCGVKVKADVPPLDIIQYVSTSPVANFFLSTYRFRSLVLMKCYPGAQNQS